MKHVSCSITAAKLVLSSVVMTVILSACGYAPVREVEVEKPQFKVTDAAPGGREAWLDSPNFYAKKEGLDVDNFYYYTGDAMSADKRMACEKAQADATDDIAKQVSTFVDTTVARASSDSTGNDTNGLTGVSASQTETSKLSSQLSKALVTGIEKNKQYWEQRDYSQTGGAKSIFYCWTLAKVSKKKVEALITRAETIRFKEDPALKTKVEAKSIDIQKEFDQYMQAH
ncbi:MAG: hypothetical protein JST80_02045 [Bdellovibrionales bacterium]|nr:hypothetical protein [Bdellovibrionales bacterium]